VLANCLGVVNRGGLVSEVARMIAYETAGGTLVVAWAIVRLRPACRALADADNRAFLSRRLRAPRRRPSCGDDAMLWKERYVTSSLRLADKLCVFLLVGGFGLWSLYFAKLALLELFALGYGASAGDGWPTCAFDWAVVIGRGIGPAPGQARALFNLVLREITVIFSVTYVLVVTEAAVRGIAREREQGTWPGLLVTPLTAWEIIRGKMLGLIWTTRWILALQVGLWSVGLAVGSVHPLGFVAALVVLGFSTGLVVALGTALAIVTIERKQATERSLLPLLLLTFSGFLPRLLPGSFASVLMGAGSIPLLQWLALLSYNDVAAARQSGSFPLFELMAFDTGEGARSVAATCLIGVAAQALAAALLTRAAIRAFDTAAGRPHRPASRRSSLPHWFPLTNVDERLQTQAATPIMGGGDPGLISEGGGCR
jgi:ABC-type transport system involved in multi-copper enzyme maturation permease subunit